MTVYGTRIHVIRFNKFVGDAAEQVATSLADVVLNRARMMTVIVNVDLDSVEAVASVAPC